MRLCLPQKFEKDQGIYVRNNETTIEYEPRFSHNDRQYTNPYIFTLIALFILFELKFPNISLTGSPGKPGVPANPFSPLEPAGPGYPKR